MKDIVERLRNWRTVHLTQLRYLMESAADEIERLRLSARADCPEPENAANEEKVSMRQNMTTLTPVERCVLREVRHGYADVDDVRCKEIAHVIDRLLSRAGSNGETAGEHAAKCTVASAKLPARELVANHPANPDSSTLTAAEREAVEWAAKAAADPTPVAWYAPQIAATLRGLLERLGGER